MLDLHKTRASKPSTPNPPTPRSTIRSRPRTASPLSALPDVTARPTPRERLSLRPVALVDSLPRMVDMPLQMNISAQAALLLRDNRKRRGWDDDGTPTPRPPPTPARRSVPACRQGEDGLIVGKSVARSLAHGHAAMGATIGRLELREEMLQAAGQHLQGEVAALRTQVASMQAYEEKMTADHARQIAEIEATWEHCVTRVRYDDIVTKMHEERAEKRASAGVETEPLPAQPHFHPHVVLAASDPRGRTLGVGRGA